MNRAWLYDLTHRGTAGDVDYYRDACQGATCILELACGTGRLLAPLSTLGAELVGLDLDAEKLDLAREKAPEIELICADMTDFDLGRQFDRIVLAYNGLFCLNDTRKLSCLEAVARHLSPGGQLLFDCYLVADEDADDPVVVGEWEHVCALVDDAGLGERVDIFERMWPAPVARAFDATYRYETETARLIDTIRHYFLTPSRVLPLFEQAGLSLEAYSSFALEPFDAESERLVGRATLACAPRVTAES